MTVLERVCAACGVVAAAPGGAGGVFAQQDEVGALRRERGQLRQQQQRLREAQLLSETSGGRKLAQAKALTRYLERVAAHRGDIQARLELAVDPHALFVSPPERHAGLCALLSSELDAHVAASAAWARATEWARAGGERAGASGTGTTAERLVNSTTLNQLRVATAGQQRLQVATGRLQTAQQRLVGGY
jgi:hypothetical protein